MIKKMTGRITLNALLVVIVLGLLLVWRLNSQNNTATLQAIELVDVIHDACFSPNGDGVKDIITFKALFQGPPKKLVFTALFVKKNDLLINFRIGMAAFSQAGKAEINMNWNGKDWHGQNVADGQYSLLMYYFDIPGLFNQLANQKIDKVLDKIEKRLLQREAQEMLKRWDGEVTVDTGRPVLTVTNPSANASTYNTTWPSEGDVMGAETLTINGSAVTIDNGHFSSLLNLQPGTNTFTFLAEDCAGNRDQQVRTIERLVDVTPPVITISSPTENENFKALPLAIAATYNDSGSGIDISTLKVLLNGSDITSSLSITENAANGEINDEALLNDGANTMRLEVSDKAGNLGTVSVHFTFEIIAAKDKTFIYGRVINIDDNNPLEGAQITASGSTTQSDSQGYWKLMFAAGGTYKIKIGKPGFTEVFRKVAVDKGKEAVSEDAYLTPLEAKTTAIGPDGGTHQSNDGSVEIVVPAGALSEVKEIQSTRLTAAKALPGDLNATDNLQYPISFLFCADLKPEGTVFAQPVKLRVKNTWGFAVGSEIPFAYWDKNTLKWVPQGMAKVDTSKAWLEAEISHFSPWDVNMPVRPEPHAGTPIVGHKQESPKCLLCLGSSVDINTGSLQTDFSLPGVKLRGGDTGVTLVYNSTTAYPTAVVSILDYQNNSLVLKPDRTQLKVASPLLGGGTGGGSAVVKALNFNAPASYGSGAFIFSGVYPSGRTVQTGYQKIDFSFTNFYPGKYAFVANWGGMPTGSTAVLSTEPAYLEDKNEEKIFMVSNVDSPFGKGWNLANLKKLHFEDNRAVVVEGNGDYREYEYGINYADKTNGASLKTTSSTMYDAEKMLSSYALHPVKQENCARFCFYSTPAAGTNQYFIVDLGQEREIYKIGIEFPEYWDLSNIWDFIKISTSVDNVTYQEWGHYGEPTLKDPAQGIDPLDYMIKSPYFINGTEQPVRYIKYELGFPGVNLMYKGAGIYRVYAIGSENEFRALGGEKWPKLSLDQPSGNYILEEYSGHKTVFDASGIMIAEKERSGRTINYEYNGDNLIKISYPENVYMEFIYNSGGKLEKVRDSSGRETLINMDQAGNLLDVTYPDNETRQFTYDERGLMTADKKGNAEKKYTWDSRYAVLKEVELPNHGKRILEPWALTNALNDKESSPEQLINFPFISGNAMESVVTFEDSRQEKYVTGSGWKWSYENNKLREKITYADLERNQLPVKIEKGASGWENTEILYNDDFQVSGVSNSRTDKRWGVQSNPSIPMLPIPGTPEENFSTGSQNYEYNDQRLLSKVTGSYLILNYTYDAKGNLLQEEKKPNDLTFLSKFTYNENNDMVKAEYPDGKINEMTYNDRGLVIEVKNNDGTKTIMERNGRGDVTAMIDEMNRRVELTRDVMGRVIKEKSPSDKEVSYQWGGAGCSSCGDGSKLTKITDAAGHAWEFKYDVMGNPLEMTYPDNSKITQEYDIAGRLSKFFNKRGQEIDYTYDADGKLTQKTTPEGDIIFTYNERERVSEIVGAGFHYRYQYGHVGNMGTLWQEEELQSASLLQMVTNDLYGMPVNIYDSFGWRKYFLYDALALGGSPKEIDYLWSGTQASFMRNSLYHDAARRLTSRGNEMFKRSDYFTYDSNGLLKQSRYAGQAGWPYFTASGSLNFTRDTSGLITGLTGDKELGATYDPDLQISSINHTLPQPFAESYTYDDNGNRLTSLTNSFIYDDLNRLTESTTHEYTYDADGNMTQEKNKLTTETKKYYYDSENRMVKYEHQVSDISPIDITATYKYDIFGRRLQKNVNGAITNFFWENDTMTYELNDQYQPIRKYLTGVGIDNYEGHLEYSEITDWPHIFFPQYNQPWYSYMKDQVGTVYQVWDQKNRVIADSRAYDSFGNLVNQTGTTKTPLGFQGKYYDSESGLNYFYHRYYNPAIGRFTSEDPIGVKGGLNLQKFVNNNPISSIDPTGTITDINSFPGNEIPPHKYSEFDITIYDYIWWTTKGSIDSIINAATGKSCSCEKIFWDCMRDAFVPGFSDVLAGAALVTGNFMQIHAFNIAAARVLISPMSSSTYRFWFNTGGNLVPFFAASQMLYDVSKCLIKEMQCLKNQ
jgi:RHS repeat-associated protein